MEYNDRTGECKEDKYGTIMKIIEYHNAHNILIEFQDENKAVVETSYCHFDRNEVRNPYQKYAYGVGYIGSLYDKKINGKDISYTNWFEMLRRCYSVESKFVNSAYNECTCCEDWLCYSKFKEWFSKNYYSCNGDRMEVDKDILVKNNKNYSPETCLIVPHKINSLFLKSTKSRGVYPIGVCYSSYSKKNPFVACMKINGKRKHLGRFSSPEIAFQKYKMEKELHIKKVANDYKDIIPKIVYDAMCKYEISIDD
jgi:hypothetical protein